MYELAPPRFENKGPLVFAGRRGRFTAATRAEIPKLWQDFVPLIPSIAGRTGHATYGLCFPMRGPGFDYVAAVAIDASTPVASPLTRVAMPAHRYAVFIHEAHVSLLHRTIDAIGNAWLPGSGLSPVTPLDDEPGLFERYGERFDAETGRGDVEVWMPIAG